MIRLFVLSTTLLFFWLPVAFAGDASPGPVEVLKTLPFSEDADVREKVVSECELQTRLPQYIAQYAEKNGQPSVRLADALSEGSAARQLHVRIINVHEGGNWFVGRNKGVTVAGELKQGGQVVGSFRAARSTSGGFAGNYKGACSFVGRCAKALGKDIAGWLQSPTQDARLGDL